MISLFGISTFKFMFAPFGGKIANLSFLETYLSCCFGAVLSSCIFYFSANFFIKKRSKSLEITKKSQEKYEIKKRFTISNKLIIKIKQKVGLVGISFWAPFFLSIPLGSIITAKFYGNNTKTIFFIILGIFFNGLITTGITYLF